MSLVPVEAEAVASTSASSRSLLNIHGFVLVRSNRDWLEDLMVATGGGLY